MLTALFTAMLFLILNEQKYAQSQTSFIYGYDKNNKEVELTRLHGDENRIWVNLEDMSEYLPKAFVSIEDKRFENIMVLTGSEQQV